MTPRVCVHAGIHKTGSTAIQSALARARKRLTEVGFAYPAPYSGGNAHHDLAAFFNGRGSDGAIAEHYRRALADASADGMTLLLSSEEFEFTIVNNAIAGMKPLFDGAEVSFVLYVLRQDLMIEKEYNQHVKQSGTAYAGSIYDFCLKHTFVPRLHYIRCIRMLENLFGAGSVSVRLFERPRLKGNDIVDDFFEAARIPTSALPSERFDDNPSLSAPALELVRRINGLGLPPARRAQVISAILRADGPQWSRPLLFSLENRRDILRRFEAGNAQLFEWLGLENAWSVDSLQPTEPDRRDELAAFVAELALSR